MKCYLLLLLTLFAAEFSVADEYSKKMHLELRELEGRDQAGFSIIKNDNFTGQSFKDSQIHNVLMFIGMVDDYADKRHFKSEFSNMSSGCKQELYVETSFIYHEDKTYDEVDRYNNELQERISSCDILDNSDRVYLISKMLEGSIIIKEFWNGSLTKAEVMAQNLRKNNEVISAEAASSLYFLISVEAIKVCKSFGGVDCLKYSQYYPFLKLTHNRILYETTDYYLTRVFYPNHLAIIEEFDYLNISYFIDQ